MDRTYLRILRELGFPPVFLIPPEQFIHVEGMTLEGSDGIASVDYPVFTVRKGLRGRAKANVLYHEIFHHLFKSKPHWWIECASERMAGGGGRGYWCRKYNHSVDEMPPRSRLLHLARLAAKRLKDSN